jgi:multicomponent K+:H+ antiporter subunit A
LATGGGALAWGYPFLTTHTAHWQLPWLGTVHVASALFFDIGVFTLVVGSTLLILTAIAHQSIRSHRWHARLHDAADENLIKTGPGVRPMGVSSYQNKSKPGGMH